MITAPVIDSARFGIDSAIPYMWAEPFCPPSPSGRLDVLSSPGSVPQRRCGDSVESSSSLGGSAFVVSFLRLFQSPHGYPLHTVPVLGSHDSLWRSLSEYNVYRMSN